MNTQSLFRKPWEAVDILYLKIWKAIHNLYFEIRETLHDLPLPRTVRKIGNSLDMQIGEGFDDLHFVIREATHELDFPVDFGGLRPPRRRKTGRDED